MRPSELSREAFDKLLRAFAGSGERYEAARWRLIKFFAWRGAADPEELADETLTRVALQIERGVAVREVDSYLHGVARIVALEDAKDRTRRVTLPLDLAQPEPDPDEERVRICFQRAFSALPPETQALLVHYYDGRGASRIAHRKRIAEELGVSENALRNRTLRLREKLEHALRDCLSRDVSTFRDTPDEEGS